MDRKFLTKEINKIQAILKRSQSLQIVGLPGSGRTLLLRTLANQYGYFYFDCSLIVDRSILIDQLKTSIDKQLAKREKVVLILDSFDFLSGSNLNEFYNLLFGLRNIQRDQIQYLFATNRQMTSNLGSLGIILTENIYYLPPFDRNDTDLFLRLLEKNFDRQLTKAQKDRLFQLSGGFPRTLKLLAKTTFTGQDQKSSIHLNYHLEQLLETLNPEKETLKNLVTNQLKPTDQTNLETLQKYYVIDQKYKFCQPVFEIFLKQKFSQIIPIKEQLSSQIKLTCQLTANEYRALKYLANRLEQICSREEIIKAIWNEKAIGIADHALDQLIHRLREKLKNNQPPLILETIRGRGHRLTLS